MLSLKGRKDNFKFLFPDNFIAKEINDKYARILQEQHSFIYKPVDFLSETVRSIQVLGFNDGAFLQQQTAFGHNLRNPYRTEQNAFPFSASDVAYRGEVNPLQLIDKTFNVVFRHTFGFLNYFLMFENFWYQYHRDTMGDELEDSFIIDFMDGYGRAYSRIRLWHPIINSMDMLSLDYTAPIAASDTFTVAFKYSNIDYQVLEVNNEEILNGTT